MPISICQCGEDSAACLSKGSVTVLRCSELSDGDVCAEKEPTLKFLKVYSLLNKGGVMELFASSLHSVLATEAFLKGSLQLF